MKLYTVGYQDKDLPELLLLLEKHDIQTVVDVRENPFSRKRGFSKKELHEALSSRGISYLHRRELGAPRRLRERARGGEDYKDFIAEYKRHLQENQEALNEVLLRLKEATCCLLCLEANPELCHRKVIAEKAVEMEPELQVAHL